MLITSLFRFAAAVIPFATSEQRPPIFAMKRPQWNPIEAMPTPLSASPQARPAVWVPCPTVSVVGELPVPNDVAPTMRPARSGFVPSAPLSTTATSAPVPFDRSQARGPPSRTTFQAPMSWFGALTSGCVMAKSLGA